MLGSVLAGLAWSVGALIAFRVIQGLGAGMLMPVGQAALVQAAGPDRMGRVMSLFGLPMLLIPTLARSSAERSPSTRAGGGSSTSTGR
jgi:MFS family permease